MVVKEEILPWFRDLESYSRIDLLCELLNMCEPFELRFLASCIEEMGKLSYLDLKQQTATANDVNKLDKDPSLKNKSLQDDSVRHIMLINIALLKSRNYNGANWYSKRFLKTDCVKDFVDSGESRIESVQKEMLLLYSMASRHPAFTFEQKLFFNKILEQLCELKERENKAFAARFPPGFENPNVYRNVKVHENVQFPLCYPMQPPGLQPHFEYMNQHFRAGWPGFNCGAPAEVPPFPHLPNMQPAQPPQPASSPLVSSPNHSRSGSPQTVPIINPAARPIINDFHMMRAAPTIPSGLTNSMSCPIELGPPPSLVVKPQSPHMDSDEANTTLKEEIPPIPPKPPVSLWMSTPSVSATKGKQINGLRIAPFVHQQHTEQMQGMNVNDDSSHYHSSSSSSPLQTPPDTPSNLPPTSSTTSTPHRATSLDKSRVNGLPHFMPPFPGDTTSPPPPPAFTFPTYAGPPLHPRFYTTVAGFRPPVTTVFGQFTAPNQPYPQGGQPTAAGTESTPYHTYPLPYISLMYSSIPPPHQPPPNPVPPRNHPTGCFNCGSSTHLGQDCNSLQIDDLTKNIFSINFSPTNSEKGEK